MRRSIPALRNITRAVHADHEGHVLLIVIPECNFLIVIPACS